MNQANAGDTGDLGSIPGGTPEEMTGKEKMLPGNFAPPPCPPTLGHFTSSWQGPSLSPSTRVALPHPGKGCKVLGSAWQLLKTQEEEGGPEREQLFPSALRKEHMSQICLTPLLGPGIPPSRLEAATAAPYRSLQEEARFRMSGTVLGIKWDLPDVSQGRGAHRVQCL